MHIKRQMADGKRQTMAAGVAPRLPSAICRLSPQSGVTLVELIVFIVVISIALTAMVSAINHYLVNSVDPVVQLRALECAQAKLDEITARKFDGNSPTGGVPACGSAETGATPCQGIVAGGQFDDVGDFNGQVDTTNSACTVSVTVVNAGTDLNLSPNEARRITVEAISGVNGRAVLSTYRTNY